MFIDHIDNIPARRIESGEVEGVLKQVVIGPDQGWEDHVMRILTIEAGGHSPRHQHPWPHINYVIEGKGELYHAGETSTIGPGSVAYLPADTDHQFRNTGPEPLKFICIVPREGEA